MPELEDERGQGLLDFPDLGPRDYVQPSGRPGPGHMSSMSEDWFTPPDVVEAVRELFGGTISLDPFSCAEANDVVRAERFFTAADDGLVQPWAGKLLVNPPWGGGGTASTKSRAVRKLIRSYREGTVTEAVVVANANATTTRWFAPLFAYPVCFPPRRINYYGPNGTGTSPNNGTVMIYVGRNVRGFADVFSRFGNIMARFAPAGPDAEAEDWDEAAG